MSARRPTSKKTQFGAANMKDGEYSKNAGTQPQPSRHSNLSNHASGVQKMQTMKQTYAMPTHRRSNTAAAFVPQMTLKQFQEQKNAAMANSHQQV